MKKLLHFCLKISIVYPSYPYVLKQSLICGPKINETVLKSPYATSFNLAAQTPPCQRNDGIFLCSPIGCWLLQAANHIIFRPMRYGAECEAESNREVKWRWRRTSPFLWLWSFVYVLPKVSWNGKLSTSLVCYVRYKVFYSDRGHFNFKVSLFCKKKYQHKSVLCETVL